MLILSRKTGERIHIGEGITVEIRRIAGNRVTLALNAPRDVRILRGELSHAAGAFEDQQNHGTPAETEVRPAAAEARSGEPPAGGHRRGGVHAGSKSGTPAGQHLQMMRSFAPHSPPHDYAI